MLDSLLLSVTNTVTLSLKPVLYFRINPLQFWINLDEFWINRPREIDRAVNLLKLRNLESWLIIIKHFIKHSIKHDSVRENRAACLFRIQPRLFETRFKRMESGIFPLKTIARKWARKWAGRKHARTHHQSRGPSTENFQNTIQTHGIRNLISSAIFSLIFKLSEKITTRINQSIARSIYRDFFHIYRKHDSNRKWNWSSNTTRVDHSRSMTSAL